MYPCTCGHVSQTPYPIGLQVYKYYLLWALTYLDMTYFGLCGAPGLMSTRFFVGLLSSAVAQKFKVSGLGSEPYGRVPDSPSPKGPKYRTIGDLGFTYWESEFWFWVPKGSKVVPFWAVYDNPQKENRS